MVNWLWGIQWRLHGRGPGDPGSPLFLDQNEARRAEKKCFEAAAPPMLISSSAIRNQFIFGQIKGSNVLLDDLLGPWKQHFLFPNTEIMLIIEDETFVKIWAVYKQFYDWRLISVCRILPWCPLHIAISVNVPLGHQRDRKKSESSICFWKIL